MWILEKNIADCLRKNPQFGERKENTRRVEESVEVSRTRGTQRAFFLGERRINENARAHIFTWSREGRNVL